MPFSTGWAGDSAPDSGGAGFIHSTRKRAPAPRAIARTYMAEIHRGGVCRRQDAEPVGAPRRRWSRAREPNRLIAMNSRNRIRISTIFGVMAVFAGMAFLAPGCGGGESGEPLAPLPNRPPVARLSIPSMLPVNREIVVDALGSYDSDGVIVEYLFAFADGTPATRTGQAEIRHSFASPGDFEVSLTVRDDDGALDRQVRPVRVNAQMPEASCGPRIPCPPNEDCREGLCWYAR
ncbi:MAG: hypothetical protein GMKNLPBB_00256 [Myxococcota bacterium]|nr:hypothetical protein [Myxococcota bacterium]